MTPRLIPISGEEVARLQLIRDHEGNDLSPNDAAVLDSLAARYEDGITAEEANSLATVLKRQSLPGPTTFRLRVGSAWQKLARFTQASREEPQGQ